MFRTHVSSLQTDDSIPDRVSREEFDVVCMSPETILLDIWLNAFSSGDFPDRLVGVFYDEVHCVPKWGHEFRPDYLLLGVVRARLPLHVPIGGFTTATLTPKAAGTSVFPPRGNTAVAMGRHQLPNYFLILPIWAK
jgi:superfamily II DNA helicase RecQ